MLAPLWSIERTLGPRDGLPIRKEHRGRGVECQGTPWWYSKKSRRRAGNGDAEVRGVSFRTGSRGGGRGGLHPRAGTRRLPSCIPAPAKTKGHQGGAPMAHRSAFRPAGVRPTRGSCCLAFAFLPASLPTTEVGDHDQDRDSRCRHFTSPPSTRFGLVDLVRERDFLVLPAGLAAAKVRDHHENHRESRHHSPLGLGFAASLASASRSRQIARAAAMPFAM